MIINIITVIAYHVVDLYIRTVFCHTLFLMGGQWLGTLDSPL